MKQDKCKQVMAKQDQWEEAFVLTTAVRGIRALLMIICLLSSGNPQWSMVFMLLTCSCFLGLVHKESMDRNSFAFVTLWALLVLLNPSHLRRSVVVLWDIAFYFFFFKLAAVHWCLSSYIMCFFLYNIIPEQHPNLWEEKTLHKVLLLSLPDYSAPFWSCESSRYNSSWFLFCHDFFSFGFTSNNLVVLWYCLFTVLNCRYGCLTDSDVFYSVVYILLLILLGSSTTWVTTMMCTAVANSI